MSKKIVIIVCLIMSIINAQGQTILEKINAIKLQSDIYFWNEFTHPDADTAIKSAALRILNYINEGKDSPETLDELMPYVKNIKMNRGTLTRAFVYVKKSELPSHFGFSQDSEATESSFQTPQAFVPDIFVQKILQQKTFSNVYKFLSDEKKQGRVLQFGALKDVEDYSSFDLILFDLKSQELIALLSPITPNGSRINQTNGTVDTLDNYPEEMVAVIWYIK